MANLFLGRGGSPAFGESYPAFAVQFHRVPDHSIVTG
jgi:hypothetical protein